MCFTAVILRSAFDASGCDDPDTNGVSVCLEADAQRSEWRTELDADIPKLARLNSQKLL